MGFVIWGFESDFYFTPGVSLFATTTVRHGPAEDQGAGRQDAHQVGRGLLMMGGGANRPDTRRG